MIKLTPIRFEGKLKGGSTKPWNVICINEHSKEIEEIACVVKLFTPSNISQSCHIAKEFICSELAREFDLDCPESYLIDINAADFRSTLNKTELADLDTKYKGITFCSKLVNASLVNDELKKTSFNIWDCATLFAFDCLIMNADRGGHHNKANLLMDDDGFILIDHELCLHFLDGESSAAFDKILEDFNRGRWQSIYLKHLFYPLLKNYRGTKKKLFDTFKEYLDRLEINRIEQLIEELKTHGVNAGESTRLIQYLYALKQNSHKYCQIMLSLVS
ncbi:HipA family kinase [Pedobacter sp. CFBP9032]|uniref:HipA family kinase n=1 Tax=Pedobacter sp. CFBP9032 TaxID=3096539 RepID=UPI002A69DE71|nr:HipA family kinase [Pedobacter sp. CFBP9032]MDY0905445.1 HipA family kinase [Pedobacter sp. CFBP9032]